MDEIIDFVKYEYRPSEKDIVKREESKGMWDWLKKYFISKIFNETFLKQMLRQGIEALDSFIDDPLKRGALAQRVNEWFNLPLIDEKQEEKILTVFFTSLHDMLEYLEKKLM